MEIISSPAPLRRSKRKSLGEGENASPNRTTEVQEEGGNDSGLGKRPCNELSPARAGGSGLRGSGLPRFQSGSAEKSTKTPSKLMGYLSSTSRTSTTTRSADDADVASPVPHGQGGPLRRRKKDTLKTPSADKLQQYFDKTITIDEDKVRTVTSSLARSRSQYKHDFKKKTEKLEEGVKQLTNMCITLIGETKQVKVQCLGHENDTDSRLREYSLQLQEMTQSHAMMQSNENKIKKEMAAMTEKCARQEASYEQMKHDTEPFRARAKDLELRLSESVTKLEAEKSLAKARDADFARIEKELAEARRDANEAKALTLEEVKKAQREHEKAMEKTRADLEKQAVSLEAKTQECIATKAELAKAQSSAEQSKEQVAAAEADKKRLYTEIEGLKDSIAHKDRSLETLMASQSDLQKQMGEERDKMRAEISSLEGERLLMTSELASKREEAGTLQREMTTSKESITMLSAKIAQKDEELHQAANLSAEIEKERELRTLAERRESAEREERIATSAQLMATQRECSAKLEAGKKKFTEAIKQMDASHKAVVSELEVSKDTISKQADSIMGLENEAVELRAQVEHACANHETVEKLGKVTGELEVLKRRMRETADSKQLELAKAMNQIEELEEKLKAGDVTRRKLHNIIQELRGNVRVFARVRPFLPSDGVDLENSSPEAAIVPRSDGSSLRIYRNGSEDSRAEDHSFAFDKVFGPSSSQDEVFTEVSEFVQSALDGYNVCLFSYGQTGSGKTHTMQGSGTGSMRGIISRAMEQVGQYKLELEKKGWVYEMDVSFVEIYNESIRDLLRDTVSDEIKHEIKRDAQGNTSITDVTMERVDPNDQEQIGLIMDLAARHRSVGQTAMNERSSRSHSVFCLHLKASNREQGIILKGALNLVDLAGSERLDRSGAKGERMRETVAINKSLSSLTDVFVAIGNKQGHIPFRNSKLTYLLQPALSGDGKTLMMVNLSPTDASFGESVCSLRFASQVNKCELGKAKKQTQSMADAPTPSSSRPGSAPGSRATANGASVASAASKKRAFGR